MKINHMVIISCADCPCNFYMRQKNILTIFVVYDFIKNGKCSYYFKALQIFQKR